MASITKTRPLKTITVLIVLFSLAISATARPCKALLISYYSFSFPQRLDDRDPSSSGIVTVFTSIRNLRPVKLNPSYNEYSKRNDPALLNLFPYRSFPTFENDEAVESGDEREEVVSSHFEPFGLPSYDLSSLRDRTKDILIVVVALLFGVGCGGLSAAAMYFVWSLFSDSYRVSYDAAVHNDQESGDDIEIPKKMGYVKIAAAEPPMEKEVKICDN